MSAPKDLADLAQRFDADRRHLQVLLRIGVRADNRIHTIDITGDADVLPRAVLALPRWPRRQHARPIGYQGHRTQGQDRKHHAR